jgi:hypothetical protein
VDNDIRAAEQAVALRSMQEVLWGGQKGEGLLYVVGQMRDSVSELVKTVKAVITDVNGSDGVRSEIRSLRSDLSALKTTEDRIENRKEKDHQIIHDRITAIEVSQLKKIEDRVDRLESTKINAATVVDWRDTSARSRDEICKRIDSIEDRIENMRTRGSTTVTAWTAIAVSTVLSIIAIYFGHPGH